MDNIDFQQHSALVNQLTNSSDLAKQLAANTLSKVTKDVPGITAGLGSPLMMVGLQKAGKLGLQMYGNAGGDVGKLLKGDFSDAFQAQRNLQTAQSNLAYAKRFSNTENPQTENEGTVADADPESSAANFALDQGANSAPVATAADTAIAEATQTVTDSALDAGTTTALEAAAGATSELIGTGIGAIVPIALGLGAILGGAFGVSSSPSSVPDAPNISAATNV
jgi:hypothetical protein